MKKSLRLRKIVELSEIKERQLAKELGDVRNHYQSNKDLLKQLQQYVAEYQKLVLSTGQAGSFSFKMKQNKYFIENLEKALDEQKTRVANLEDKVMDYQKNWYQALQKVKNIQKIEKRERRKEIDNKEKNEGY